MRKLISWKIFYDDETTFSSNDGKPEQAPKDGVQVIVSLYDNNTFNITEGQDYYYWSGDSWAYGGLPTLEKWVRKELPNLKFSRFTSNKVYQKALKEALDHGRIV